MKNKIFSLIASIMVFPVAAFAQLTLDAESGNIGIEQGNCWQFGSHNYTSTQLVIAGNYSLLTTSNSTNVGVVFVKTPWMKIGSGSITFRARLTNNQNFSRGVSVSYIPYNELAGNKEGSRVTFYTYNFPTGSTAIRDISAPIPVEIANSVGVYKIEVSYFGQNNGNGRVVSDSYVFPGTYWSDPSNSCNPLPIVTPPADADGDGVPDSQDEYPADPYRAHNNYYPALSQFGTLAFEDNWPAKGDYDFNDVVVDYNFNTITNGDGNVVEVIGTFILRASGAVYQNGFGIQFDGISWNKISKVSGNTPGSYPMLANGAEAGQHFANIMVFDNFLNIMLRPGMGIGVNTDITAPYVMPVSKQVVITFIDNGVPAAGGVVTLAQLPFSIFNYYIFINKIRSKEVHLPNRVPTTLAGTDLFGTNDDNSNPVEGRYYKTANNLPWAIDIIQGFQYTIEKASIDQGYLHFTEWATSAGVQYPDWFLNLPGYRVAEKIY
jgi:LruC domain-containing protein